MRQVSSLSFVTVTQKSSSTDILVDTTGVDSGAYTLILESFNTLSIAKSALKTDTIEITVISMPLTFQSDPETVFVTAGIKGVW